MLLLLYFMNWCLPKEKTNYIRETGPCSTLEKPVHIALYRPSQVSRRTNDFGLYSSTSYACVDHQSGTTNVLDGASSNRPLGEMKQCPSEGMSVMDHRRGKDH